ncbi:MAG: 30S ribosome-binding factor RbfA [Chloroflexota bacterium]|nr:30S ribosome-binding factor RbfA [Chloroflexota bacterium]|tara:strand:+ start:3220 stop:3564 length:345 start_codon:yes stop_codon:yes gene_type:complete
MVDFRLEKFNNSVKKIVGDYLSKYFYNDGSTIISITDVITSRDFAHAKILLSIFTEDYSIDSIVYELNQKKSLFQNKLSKSIRTSRIPKIKFEYDNSSEFQKQIDDLINQISTE